MERTLSIIKPDAVRAGNMGPILAQLEAAGLKIVAMKLLQLTKERAEGFYEVHKDRPFFGDLVEFMTSGPVVVRVLAADAALACYRKLMGATNPSEAEAGTLRKQFATDIHENACHGSDAPEPAATETAYFFTPEEYVS